MLNYILLILVREKQHKNKYSNIMDEVKKPHPFYKIKARSERNVYNKKRLF